MYRRPASPSLSAWRSDEMWTLRLPSLTKVLGQTIAVSSCLLTVSPGRASRAIKRSRARPPSRTGSSPSSRSRCLGRRRKQSKPISRGSAAAVGRTTWLTFSNGDFAARFSVGCASRVRCPPDIPIPLLASITSLGLPKRKDPAPVSARQLTLRRDMMMAPPDFDPAPQTEVRAGLPKNVSVKALATA